MKSLAGIKTFFSDVVGEVKKTTWPAREELMQSTVVVIISILLLSVFIAASDKIISVAIGLLTG